MLTSDTEINSYLITWISLNILWIFTWLITFLRKAINSNHERFNTLGSFFDVMMIMFWCIIIISYLSLKIYAYFGLI